MTLKICTVYDAKAECYMTPMYFKHRGDAIRSFTEAANDKNTTVGKYPADFTLFELGTFDEATCRFVINSSPTPLGCAIEFVCLSVDARLTPYLNKVADSNDVCLTPYLNKVADSN